MSAKTGELQYSKLVINRTGSQGRPALLRPAPATASGRAEEINVGTRLARAILAREQRFRFGGEAALPLHYFRVMRRRGVAVWLVVHARTRSELSELFPDDPPTA